MKKKLLSLVMSFMMIFTCVIPISAQSTNRPAESNIVDILEDFRERWSWNRNENRNNENWTN